MSHEIRTPLNGIIGMLDAAGEEPLPASARGCISLAQQSAATMLELVNDLLDLSRIEAGKQVLKLEPLNLGPLLTRAAASVHPLAAKKKLRLETDLGNTDGCWVLADGKALRQVFINLVGNAIKFTEVGSVTLQAGVTDEGNGNLRFTLTVKDTGIGIPEAALPRLFHRFETAGESHRTEKSTGLGLSITKELVSLMAGDISVESTVNVGTSFTLSIPLSYAQTQMTEMADAQETSHQATTSLDGIQLIAVDDNPINRAVLGKLCRSLNINATIFDGGDALINHVRDHLARNSAPPDIMLVDINMPGKDGMSVMREVRQMDGWAGTVPAVAFTAHAVLGAEKEFLAAGMQGYIAKPINRTDFIQELRRCLSN